MDRSNEKTPDAHARSADIARPEQSVQFEQQVAGLPYAEQVAALQPEMPLQFNLVDGAPAVQFEESGTSSETGDTTESAEPVTPFLFGFEWPWGKEEPKEPLDAGIAHKALQEMFGSWVPITEVPVQVLSQAEFTKVVEDANPGFNLEEFEAKNGTIQGTAVNGVSYINGDAKYSGNDTIIHEMLHCYVPPLWRTWATVGGAFDEGITQWITNQVCAEQDVKMNSAGSYAAEVAIIDRLVAMGLNKDYIYGAYFTGDVQSYIGAWYIAAVSPDFVGFVTAMNSNDLAGASGMLDRGRG